MKKVAKKGWVGVEDEWAGGRRGCDFKKRRSILPEKTVAPKSGTEGTAGARRAKRCTYRLGLAKPVWLLICPTFLCQRVSKNNPPPYHSTTTQQQRITSRAERRLHITIANTPQVCSGHCHYLISSPLGWVLEAPTTTERQAPAGQDRVFPSLSSHQAMTSGGLTDAQC